MNVSQFVSATLSQILEGIQRAQVAVSGENINAKFAGGKVEGNIIHADEYGVFTRVDFDIAVSAESRDEPDATLQISVLGTGAGDQKIATASRVSFSVPVRLPDGDRTRADAHEDAERRKREGLRTSRGGDWMV